VPLNALQPMLDPGVQPRWLPGWVAVSAAYAAVRRYASASAPLLASPGHGAVFWATKALGEWLALDLDGQVGWAQASALSLAEPAGEGAVTHATLHQGTLQLWQGTTPLAALRVNAPTALAPGEQRILRRLPGGPLAGRLGVPWQVITDQGLTLHGAYWHHQWGGSLAEPRVELSVIGAQMVFGLLSPGQRLIMG
ncbi:MAG: hypothetical protein HC915_08620, partial [Anaerolineae bacterium]|nr:hypothetical protein [Anaerolineae bacterium]